MTDLLSGMAFGVWPLQMFFRYDEARIPAQFSREMALFQVTVLRCLCDISTNTEGFVPLCFRFASS